MFVSPSRKTRKGCASGVKDMRELIDLDEFDIRLLASLEEDGRLTNQELAERVRLSASQCSRRRVRLETAGIIKGYRAELSAERLGFAVTVFVNVTLATHSHDVVTRFRELISEMDEVQEAYALTGDMDYLVRLVLPDLAGLARVVNQVLLPHESVQHLRSSIVLETLRDDRRLPLTEEGG